MDDPPSAPPFIMTDTSTTITPPVSVHFPPSNEADDSSGAIAADEFGSIMDSDPFTAEIMEITRHLRGISRSRGGKMPRASSDVSEEDDHGGDDDDDDWGLQSLRDELNQIDSAFDLERAIMGILSSADGPEASSTQDEEGGGQEVVVASPGPMAKRSAGRRRRSSMSELRDLLIGQAEEGQQQQVGGGEAHGDERGVVASPSGGGVGAAGGSSSSKARRKASITVVDVLRGLQQHQHHLQVGAEVSSPASRSSRPGTSRAKLRPTPPPPPSGAGGGDDDGAVDDDNPYWNPHLAPVSPTSTNKGRAAPRGGLSVETTTTMGSSPCDRRVEEQQLDKQISDVLTRAKKRRGSWVPMEVPDQSHVDLVKALLVATDQYEAALEASRAAVASASSPKGRGERGRRRQEEGREEVEALRREVEAARVAARVAEEERDQALLLVSDRATQPEQQPPQPGSEAGGSAGEEEVERIIKDLEGQVAAWQAEARKAEETAESMRRALEEQRRNEVRVAQALDHELEERLKLASEVARLKQEAEVLVARRDEEEGEVQRLREAVAKLTKEMEEGGGEQRRRRQGGGGDVSNEEQGEEEEGEHHQLKAEDDWQQQEEVVASLLAKVGHMDAEHASLEAAHTEALGLLQQSMAECGKLMHMVEEMEAAAEVARRHVDQLDGDKAALEARCEELDEFLRETQRRLDEASLGVMTARGGGRGGGAVVLVGGDLPTSPLAGEGGGGQGSITTTTTDMAEEGAEEYFVDEEEGEEEGEGATTHDGDDDHGVATSWRQVSLSSSSSSSSSSSRPRRQQHHYSRIFTSLVNMSVDGQGMLAHLDANLKAVMLSLAPPHHDDDHGDDDEAEEVVVVEEVEACYERLAHCMTLTLEALDRFDWITAQLQELQQQQQMGGGGGRRGRRGSGSGSHVVETQQQVISTSSGGGITIMLRPAPRHNPDHGGLLRVTIQGSRQTLSGVFWLDRVFELWVESGGDRWAIERTLTEFRALWGKVRGKGGGGTEIMVGFPSEKADLMGEEVRTGVAEFLACLSGYPEVLEGREVMQFLAAA